MEKQSIVSEKAIIREMDAEELEAHAARLMAGTDDSDIVIPLLYECKRQYMQLTGEHIDIQRIVFGFPSTIGTL